MLLGLYFLLRNLDISYVDDMDVWQFAVPAILIIMGLGMLTRGPSGKREERKARLRQERHDERERRRQERDERRSRRHHEHSSRGHNRHGEPAEEEVPPFDPSFSRKIEQDLDQVFHERVVKKLGEDPFPLASEAGIGAPAAKQGQQLPKNSYTEGKWEAPPKEEWRDSWYDQNGGKPPVERSNFIGDIHLGRDYWQLEPMNISHFIGDTMIDLTKASIPMGETKLTVSAFIGDVKVFVPNDIQLEISVSASAFIGDMRVLDRYEGGMFRNMRYDTRNYAEADKKIHLTVSMFIGDITVKRVG
ncbi:hypothetical protein D3C75_821550 [compost metagenome]